MNKNLAEFRYPDGIKNLGDKEEYALTAWWRLVNWMAHSNPNPKYMEYKYANEEEFLADESRY
jgi:hypothetical protein